MQCHTGRGGQRAHKEERNKVALCVGARFLHRAHVVEFHSLLRICLQCKKTLTLNLSIILKSAENRRILFPDVLPFPPLARFPESLEIAEMVRITANVEKNSFTHCGENYVEPLHPI